MPTLTASPKPSKLKTRVAPTSTALARTKGTAVTKHHSLAESEAIISSQLKGTLKASRTIGAELRCIRDNKTYTQGKQRGVDYTTFERYCETRWNYKRSRAYQLIDYTQEIEELSTTVDNSAALPERAMRELPRARKDPKGFIRVAKAVVKAYPDPDKPPTAKQVKAERLKVEGKKKGKDPKTLTDLKPAVKTKEEAIEDEWQPNTPAGNAAKKVQKLLLQAVDVAGTPEAQNALTKARALIKQYNLVIVVRGV